MYVCMYVCVYVCMYMYVCMYICMYISKTTGVGFVKQVGFKPGVKERGSYG